MCSTPRASNGRQRPLECLCAISFLLILLFSLPALGENPVPFVNQPLVPEAAVPGGPSFTLTVNGTGFVPESVVNWNAAPLATAFVSGSQLTATVPAANLVNSGTASVTVSNPTPGGGVSNVVFFVVSNPTSTLTFTQLWPNSAVPQTLQPHGLITADFNGDGILDLAYLTNATTNNVIVQLGYGDGTFKVPLTYSAGLSPSSMVAADFNGDGKLDLAVSDGADQTVYILLGNGDGTFQPPLTVATGLSPSGIVAGGGYVPALSGGTGGSAPIPIVAADFNGDGNLDLAVGSDTTGGGVVILLGNGDGTFRPPVSYGTSTCASYMAVGDFNRDGKLDLVYADCVTPGTGLWFLPGKGDGSFQPPVSISGTPSLGTITMLAAADLSGDGKLDLIAGELLVGGASQPSMPPNPPSGAWVWLGNGDGTFQSPVEYANATDLYSFGLALGDFTANGILDAVLANVSMVADDTGDGVFSVLLGNGNGTFQNDINFPATPGFASVVAGDFNGDGKMDLAVPTALTDNLFYANNTPTDSLYVIVFLQGQIEVPEAFASSSSETFGSTDVNTTSQPLTMALTNVGTGTLTVTSIGITGADAGDFAQTNNCGSTLAPGAFCQINMTFTPTTSGNRTAVLSFVDNAKSSPQTVALTGVGLGPSVELSPGSLTFPGQFVGTTGLPQNITLTNNSTAALTISSIQATAQFQATNGCTSVLEAGVSCTISVFFDPSSAGTQTGTLTITDNAPNSPQTVALSGAGQDFAMSTTSSSATVAAGQTANYSLSVAPEGGLNQTVSLTCSGAPQLSTCTLTPNSVALNGSASATVTVAVSTTAPTMLTPMGKSFPQGLEGGWILWVYIFLVFVSLAALCAARRRPSPWLWGTCLLMMMVCAACGGGSNVVHSPGTPTGTYTLKVTGIVTSAPTSTQLTHVTNLTLTVN